MAAYRRAVPGVIHFAKRRFHCSCSARCKLFRGRLYPGLRFALCLRKAGRYASKAGAAAHRNGTVTLQRRAAANGW